MVNLFKNVILNNFNYNDPFKDAVFKENTAKIVNQIFVIISANKTAFSLAYPNEQSLKMAKAIWIEALYDAKLCNLNLIEKGILKMLRDPNPFAITVGAFIKLCQDEIKPQTDTRSVAHEQEHQENYILNENNKKNWKPGYIFPQYAHLKSRDKAMPVIMKLLDKIDEKQRKSIKTMIGA